MIKRSSCYYCLLSFYCYSEASSGTVYVQFPNGGRIYSTNAYGDVRVQQTSPSGVLVRNYRYYFPDFTGVYTCEAPDSRGNTLPFSIVWYATYLPGMHLDRINAFTLFMQIHIFIVNVFMYNVYNNDNKTSFCCFTQSKHVLYMYGLCIYVHVQCSKNK